MNNKYYLKHQDGIITIGDEEALIDFIAYSLHPVKGFNECIHGNNGLYSHYLAHLNMGNDHEKVIVDYKWYQYTRPDGEVVELREPIYREFLRPYTFFNSDGCIIDARKYFKAAEALYLERYEGYWRRFMYDSIKEWEYRKKRSKHKSQHTKSHQCGARRWNRHEKGVFLAHDVIDTEGYNVKNATRRSPASIAWGFNWKGKTQNNWKSVYKVPAQYEIHTYATSARDTIRKFSDEEDFDQDYIDDLLYEDFLNN